MSDTATTEQKTALPLYKDPQVVSSERHAKAGSTPMDNYTYAKEQSSFVVNASEIAIAAKHYPIVFAMQAPYLPMAVMGLQVQKNSFVDEHGAWEAGCYIPGYVRRYPFTLMQSKDEKLILAVDEKSDVFASENPENAFFDGEQPSDYVKKVMEFCQQYQNDHLVTRQITQQLFDANLLVSREVTIKDEAGKEMKTGGFYCVDEKTLNELTEKTVYGLHRSGALSLAYFHLASMSNWQAVAAKSSADVAKAAA